MNTKEFALKTYHKFAQLEGNQYIAGDYALEKILNLITTFKPTHVLEVGLGIGSISDTILNYCNQTQTKIQYTGTEENEFCLAVLPKYVDLYSEIHLYQNIDEIQTTGVFDFVIVDGSDESLIKAKDLCTKNAMIFIEGGRMSQVNEIKKIFPNYRYAEIISTRKPPSFGPFQQKWTGGGSLIFVNPTLKQKAYCFNEKVKTFIKRRLRKFIK